jgi:mRNA interferase HigB
MRIISRAALRDFWEDYPETEQTLKTWFQITKSADWDSPIEVKSLYPNVKLSFLSDNRIVFGIKGNKFRLIVKVEYAKKLVFIRFIGTHSEYDKIDANNI